MAFFCTYISIIFITVYTDFISADKYPTPMVIIIEYEQTPQGAAQFIPS